MTWQPPQNIGDRNPAIVDAKRALRKYSYGKVLDDTDVYTAEFGVALRQFQSNVHTLVTSGRRPQPDVNLNGVFDWATKRQLGLIAAPSEVGKPVIFTVEGHLSDMLVGPCYFTARALEERGLVRVQPVGYDNTSLPFRSQTGVAELARLVNDPVVLPPGTRWMTLGFSQGAIVTSTFYLDHIRPNIAKAPFTLWRGGINFGNPYREQNVCAPWVPDPPPSGTEGISPRRIDGTPPELMEHSRKGDMYAQVKHDAQATEHMRSIYLAAAEGKFISGADNLAEQIGEIVTGGGKELWAVFTAIANGVRFLGSMGPHGQYDLGPCIDFCRQRLA
jgi:hypothetical protein